MSIIDNIARRLGYQKAQSRRQSRAFSGAQTSNLTASMAKITTPPDTDIRRSLRILRARSRELAQNNDHVRRFFSLLKTNVLGDSGIILQSRVTDVGGKIDEVAATAIEKSWVEWCKRGSAEVTRKLSFTLMTKVALETVARDGECFIRLHRGFDNRHGFALELIDPEAVAVDYDVLHRKGAQNEIRMGVELDEWGAEVAYHLRAGSTDHYFYTGATYTRIPADEMIHLQLIEAPNQTRSVPWITSALLRLGMLGGYEEAELTAARVGASKMGFFTSGIDSAGYGQQEDGGDLVVDMEPGEFEELPAGVDFKPFDPQHPTSAYGDFVKEVLRAIASGLGVSYNSLANDLEGVNFSSLRQGAIDERNTWKMLQNWIIESLHERVFNEWVEMALLHGIPTGFGGNLRPADVERYSAASWQPRRWQWVDPLKEMRAHESALALGVRSVSEIIREQGRDPLDVWREIKRDREMMVELGISIENDKIAESETNEKTQS